MEKSIVNIAQILESVGIDPGAATVAQKTLAILVHAPCEAVVRSKLRHEPTLKVHDLYLPVGDVCQDQYLVLKHPPLRKVDSVWVNIDKPFNIARDTTAGDSQLVENTDFYVEWTVATGEDSAGLKMSKSATLVRRSYPWPDLPGTMRVRYTAGYTVSEFLGYGAPEAERAAVIFSATLRYCSMAYKNFEKQRGTTGLSGLVLPPGTVTSEKLGDYSYAMDPASAASLSGFRMEMPPEAFNQLAMAMDKAL